MMKIKHAIMPDIDDFVKSIIRQYNVRDGEFIDIMTEYLTTWRKHHAKDKISGAILGIRTEILKEKPDMDVVSAHIYGIEDCVETIMEGV